MNRLLETIPALLELASEDLQNLGPQDLLQTLPDGLTKVTVDIKDIQKRLMEATGVNMAV